MNRSHKTFDFSAVPPLWLHTQPALTRMFDGVHILFPPAERWFVRVANQAFARLESQQLRSATRMFIEQEGSHARNHQKYLDHLRKQALDVDPLVAHVEAHFRHMRRLPLAVQLSLVAAAEHYTAEFAAAMIEQPFLADADPVMKELFLWHSAEEIEHKCVAYDLREELAPGYLSRMMGLLAATLGIHAHLVSLGVILTLQDSSIPKMQFLRDFVNMGIRAPNLYGVMARAFLAYVRPGFHPSQRSGKSCPAA